jgi:predicted ATPase
MIQAHHINRDAVRVTDNLSIGPFVLGGAPRALRFEGQLVDLEETALALLAAIARSADGVAAATLWPLVSAADAVDEDRLCDVVGDINNALGGWSPAWYVAWYPDDAVPRFALVDATPRTDPVAALPARRTDIVGRDDAIARVGEQLQERRFITILGAGGMGKTTVALAVAHDVACRYPDGVHVVDLAPVVDPALVAQRVAAAVGAASTAGDGLALLRQWARGRRALVVLDSCEHVIDDASRVAEALLADGPPCAVLATSREPLRAAGEWLHRLTPMQLPQPGETIAAAQVAAFPALRLFVERASAADAGFVLRDEDVPRLVCLCTRLDGIPLAIEIVAARVDTLGLATLASQLESRLLRLPGRRRSAPARHGTLGDLLDWSFQLLSPVEQRVLQRLSVFRNGFALAAAVEVVADDAIGADEAEDALLDLIAKSLVAPARGGDPERRRLLDTTRAYAADKLDAAGERDAVCARHGRWLAGALAEAERSWNRLARPQWVERYAPLIDDVRSALDWAFTPGGDLGLGVELTISGFALGRQMLLVDEFTARVERAIEALATQDGSAPAGSATQGQQARLSLLIASLGTGGGARTKVLASTLEDAAATAAGADAMHRFVAFNGMWALCVARGDFGSGATWSGRLEQLAAAGDDPIARLVAGRIQAQNLHFLGRHAQASEHAHRVIEQAWRTIPLSYNPSPVELRVSMRVVLARALWMQGFPERAAAMAREALEQARTDSPLAQCQAITMGALVVALWSGDDETAQALANQLIALEATLGFDHWLRWARRLREVVALRAGDTTLASRDDEFFNEPEPVLSDHLATMDERWLTPTCVARVATGKVGWCAPEALRRQGERALRAGTADGLARGEDLLQRSLALAREHGAPSWALRTATSLARLRLARDRHGEARALLEPVLAGFTEGFGTHDLREARRLLETW